MKKTLALILAIVMCFSLFVVGASAANDEFTDKDEITNTEAVNLLVGLGVIDGMGDGTFDPNGTITRAQMCQIIAKICNGGKLPNINTTEQHFTDVPVNHWAYQAIEYCVGKGIVSGYGDGTFGPSNALTGSQCAKMLLVAMGYNPTVHKLTGDSWEIYTAVYANGNNFYEDIEDVDVSVPIIREDVCQMAYNMLQCPVVKVNQSIDSDGKITSTYSQTNAAGTADNPDVITEYFGVVVEYGYMTRTDYNLTKGEWTYYITDEGDAYGNTAELDDAFTKGSVVSEDDYTALVNRQVCVVYKEDDTKVVFDIYATEDSSVITTGILADLPDTIDANNTKIEIDEVKYSLTENAGETPVIVSAGYVENVDFLSEVDELIDADVTDQNEDADNLRPWWAFKLIDNTGDDKADVIAITPVDIAKITYAGSTSISLARIDGNRCDWTADNYELDNDDWSFDKNLEKNDYAVVALDNKGIITVTPMENIRGKVDGTKDNQIRIDGTFYNYEPSGETNLTLGSSFELEVYNGYAFYVDTLSSASTDLLLVKKVSGDSDNINGVQAKVMFLDGEEQTVTISRINEEKIDSYREVDTDTLYTYTISKGEYELIQLGENAYQDDDDNWLDNFAGYDVYVDNEDAGGDFNEKTSSEAANIDGYTIADSAIIIVNYDTADDNKYAVVSGADFKGYTNMELSNYQLLLNTKSGISSIEVAFIQTEKASIGADYIYGYVTEASYETKIDGTRYTNYVIWTKDGELEVTDTSTRALQEGDCVGLTKNTDGTYTRENVTFEEVAITGYSAADELITIRDTNGDIYEGLDNKIIPDNFTVINVNSKDEKGVNGDVIDVASEAEVDGDDVWYTNAMAYYDGNDNLCIIFDINNNWNGANTTVEQPAE